MPIRRILTQILNTKGGISFMGFLPNSINYEFYRGTILMKCKLHEIADILIGYQTRGRIEPDSNGTCRILQIKDLKHDYTFQPEDLIKINPGPKVGNIIIQQNDILFFSRGYRNVTFPANISAPNVVPANSFFILRITSDKVLPEYLSWYINQTPAQNYIKTIARRGSLMFVVPKSSLGNLPIEIPPLDIQRKIIALVYLQRRGKELLNKIVEMKGNLVQKVCIKALNPSKPVRRRTHAKCGE